MFVFAECVRSAEHTLYQVQGCQAVSEQGKGCVGYGQARAVHEGSANSCKLCAGDSVGVSFAIGVHQMCLVCGRVIKGGSEEVGAVVLREACPVSVTGREV
jgi:hypothetical protein